MRRLLALALLALPALPAALPSLADEPSREWHWKSDTTLPGLPSAMTSETWIKGDRVRIVTQTPIGPSITVVKDRVAYVNAGGMAMKMSMNVDRAQGPQPAELARNLDEILKTGTKTGMETIDGESCEKWEVKRAPEGGGRPVEMTLWVSPSLRFPRQVAMQTEQGRVVVKNHEIEKRVTLPAKEFEPDPSLTYEDVTERLKEMQGAAPPR